MTRKFQNCFTVPMSIRAYQMLSIPVIEEPLCCISNTVSGSLKCAVDSICGMQVIRPMLHFGTVSDSDEMSCLQRKETLYAIKSESRQMLVLLRGDKYYISRGNIEILCQHYKITWRVDEFVLKTHSFMLKPFIELCFDNMGMDIQSDVRVYRSCRFALSVSGSKKISIANEFKPRIAMGDIKPLTLSIDNQNNFCIGLTSYLHKMTATTLAFVKSTSYYSETSASDNTSKTVETRTSETSNCFILILCFFYVLASDKCLEFIWYVMLRNKLNDFLIYSHKVHKMKSKDSDKELLNYLLNLRPLMIQQNIQAYPVDRLSVNYILDREPSGNTSLSRDSMSNELIRLSTFSNYPQTGVSLIRLAAAGFYSEGQTDEVVCFACGLRIKDWNAYLNPTVVHQQRYPECQHIREITSTAQSEELNAAQIASDVNTIGNTTRSEQSHQPICTDVGSNEVHNNLLISSSQSAIRVPGQPSGTQSSPTTLEVGNRSLSSSNLPLSALYREGDSVYGSTSSLCSNTNTTNTHGLSGRWGSSDSGFGSGFTLSNPLQQTSGNENVVNVTQVQHRSNHDRHYRHEQGYSFTRQISVDGASNLTGGTGKLSLIVEEIQQSQPDVPSGNDNERAHISAANNSLSGTSDKPAIVSYKKYPEYESMQRRTNSFKNWPSNKNFINVTDLAECGFFFTNVEDCVRCFQCGIGLKNWESGDMVCVEHAKWSSRCPYLIEIKGQSFVESVLKIVSNLEIPTRYNIYTFSTCTHIYNKNKLRGYGVNVHDTKSKSIQRKTWQRIDDDELQTSTAQNPTTSHDTSTDVQGCRLGLNYLLEHNAVRYVLTEKIFENEELIKKCMDHLLKTMGWDSITNETLVACILDTIGTDVCPSVSSPNLYDHSDNYNTSEYLSSTTADANDKTLPTTEMTPNEVTMDSKSKADEEPEKIQKENEEMRDLYTCKICLDEKVGITFVPCGHLVTCRNCSPKLRKCPLCRTFIRGTIKTTI